MAAHDMPWQDMPHPAALEHHERPRDEPPSLKPPHSLEAEREVLAAVFVDARALTLLAERLKPGEFYVDRHQRVFAMMLAMHARGVAVDSVTLGQALRDAGQFERVGGARTIGELLDRAGTVTNLEHYIAIVAAKARLRSLLDLARATEAAVLQDVGDVDGLMAETRRQWEGTFTELAPPVVEVPLDLRTLTEAGKASYMTEAPPKQKSLLLWREGLAEELFMPDGCVSLLASPGGVGKSFAFLGLAIAIATGTTWLGTYQVERKGKVFIELGEESEEEFQRRLYWVAKMLGDRQVEGVDYLYSEAARNIVAMPMMGKDIAFLGKDGEPTKWHAQLLRELAGHDLRAILFDPLSRCGGPEIEKDAYAATKLIQLLEQFTALPSAPAVVVSHHANKGALSDEVERTQGLVRGHSALVDGPRWVGFLESLQRGKVRKDRLRLTVVKGNRGPKPDPLELVRGKGGVLRPMQEHELVAEREEMERAREEWKRNKRLGQENTL